MNAIADKARQNALQFECKKDGLKQLQSGEWTLSLKVHANDVPADLLTAAMGTRYMAAIVEVGDDEQPICKPKDADTHRLSRQAAMLCQDPMFKAFLTSKRPALAPQSINGDWAAGEVRRICSVGSRSEFDTNPEAAARWRDLKADYEAWKIT
jgi:hypothetical protein